jgi:flagellar biogenesis protein FliO
MAFAMPLAARRPSPRARALLVRLLPALLLALGALLLTQPWNGDAANPAKSSASGLEPASLVGALLVVSGLLFFLPSIARRLAPGAAGGRIAVVEQRPLGGRKALLLVEVAGRRLLIGASESGLTTLAELPQAADADADAGAEPRRSRLGFPRALDQALASDASSIAGREERVA